MTSLHGYISVGEAAVILRDSESATPFPLGYWIKILRKIWEMLSRMSEKVSLNADLVHALQIDAGRRQLPEPRAPEPYSEVVQSRAVRWNEHGELERHVRAARHVGGVVRRPLSSPARPPNRQVSSHPHRARAVLREEYERPPVLVMNLKSTGLTQNPAQL